jgi:hypothetical protein
MSRPAIRGVVFDLPGAANDATSLIARQGLADRIQFVGGSAFDSVPSGGDVYVISRVLHDFDDTHTLAVLRNVRSAMTSSGTLVVVDALLLDRPGFNPGRLADLGMLMVLGGRYRTERELTDLIEAAGFQIDRTVQPRQGADPRAESAIIAVPA